MKSPSLLRAAEDPDLFGVDLWPRQRDILKVVESGRHREIVLCLGRRSGKSTLSALVAAYDAVFADLTAFGRPGEPRYVVVVAVNREQAGVVLGMVKGLLSGSPLLAGCVEGETAESVTVRQPGTGASVVVKSMPGADREWLG